MLTGVAAAGSLLPERSRLSEQLPQLNHLRLKLGREQSDVLGGIAASQRDVVGRQLGAEQIDLVLAGRRRPSASVSRNWRWRS